MTVRFFIKLSSASCTTRSDLLSKALVASSKITIGACPTKVFTQFMHEEKYLIIFYNLSPQFFLLF